MLYFFHTPALLYPCQKYDRFSYLPIHPPLTPTLLPLFKMFVVVSYNEEYAATTRKSIRSNKRTLVKETSIMFLSMYSQMVIV